jgi:hypothetical protein
MDLRTFYLKIWWLLVNVFNEILWGLPITAALFFCCQMAKFHPKKNTCLGCSKNVPKLLSPRNFHNSFFHKINKGGHQKHVHTTHLSLALHNYRLQKLKMIRLGWGPCLPATLCVRILTRNKHKRKKSR